MTPTVLSFPTPWDRDAAEFERTGTSNLIRAYTDAARLWDEAAVNDGRSGFSERLTSFSWAVPSLTAIDRTTPATS
jgi:hypothetical protein